MHCDSTIYKIITQHIYIKITTNCDFNCLFQFYSLILEDFYNHFISKQF